MSPSRRSSRSTRSSKPPVWRTVSISKNSAAPSLSYVFAEPEQGSPLLPATPHLSTSISSGGTEKSEPQDPLPGLRTRIASMSSYPRDIHGEEQVQSRGEEAASSSAVAPLLALQGSGSNTRLPPADAQHAPDPETILAAPTPTISVAEHTATPTPTPSNVPLPTTAEPTPTSTPRKSSWFGSLSRAKGKQNAAKLNIQTASSPDPLPTSQTQHEAPLESTSVPSYTTEALVESPTSTSPPSLPPTSAAPPSSRPLPIPAASPAPVTSTASTSVSPTPAPAPADISPPQPQTPVRRSWFTSSPSPAPRPELHGPQTSASNSIPSSIDEEVPALSVVTPPSSSPPTSPSIISNPSTQSNGGTGRARLSSLNPSTSRFTLSIPLLGRAKMPLETAVAVAQSEEAKNGPKEAAPNPEETKDAATATDIPAIEVTSADPPNTADVPTPAPADADPPPKVRSASLPPPTSSSPSEPAILPSSSSWWSYVGWNTPASASTSSVPGSLNDVPDDSKTDEASTLAAPSTPGTGMTEDTSSSRTVTLPTSNSESHTAQVPGAADPSATSDTEPKANGVGSAEANAKASASVSAEGQPKEEGETAADGENAGGEDKGSSIRSAETAQSQGSTAAAWYTPWTWYAAPAPVHPAGTSDSGGVDAGLGSGDGNGHEVAGDGRGAMSPADMVKEAALAREEEEAKVVEGKAEEKAQAADVNPVAETISTNRSGWVSFFSSASLMRKTITDEQADAGKTDENGMEVMDVPEEGDAGAEEQMRGRDAGKAKAVGGDVKDAGRRGGSPVSVNNGIKPSAPPLTISENVKRETVKSNLANKKKDLKVGKKSASPSPSTKSAPAAPRTPVPNLILPTWADTFHTAPRSVLPPQPTSKFSKTMKFVSGVLFPTDKPETAAAAGRSKGKGREHEFAHFGKELPRAWDVLQERLDPDVLRGCRRVIVIGIHGWFPGAVMRTVLGEPTGTSAKFVSMMVQALEEFQEQHGVKFEKITTVPLEGEGTIEGRVAKLYANLQANQEWMDALHAADAVLIATHSQGSIVSTHLLDRLIRDRHIRTSQNTVIEGASELLPVTGLTAPALQPQRVCCLALCGIHLGPLRYLSSSSLLQPYFHYFESAAARELFEFQNTESEVSKNYVKVLSSVVNHGVKMVYVASLNDQVVPIYSGLFTAVSHPLILRALYIDGDAYHSSDFLSNLLVLLLRVLNSGISDSGLTVHLSEATAGSLSGVGHSTAYEELSTYSLAVKYLFLTNNGLEDRHTDLVLEPFNATTEQNDYEIPWALRDVIADERVEYFFSREIAELRDAFRDWHPKTTVLRDLKRKLQPIQRLPSSFFSPSASKL